MRRLHAHSSLHHEVHSENEKMKKVVEEVVKLRLGLGGTLRYEKYYKELNCDDPVAKNDLANGWKKSCVKRCRGPSERTHQTNAWNARLRGVSLSLGRFQQDEMGK